VVPIIGSAGPSLPEHQGWVAARQHVAAALDQGFSSATGGVPADQLSLPGGKLNDDLEDGFNGKAVEAPLEGEDELPRPAAADSPALGTRQQGAPVDVLASLPLGQALRQEAQVQGRTWSFETGKVARLASGSCMVQAGGTTVLAAATSQAPPWSRREAHSLQLEVTWHWGQQHTCCR
jgi:hypothetical protein